MTISTSVLIINVRFFDCERPPWRSSDGGSGSLSAGSANYQADGGFTVMENHHGSVRMQRPKTSRALEQGQACGTDQPRLICRRTKNLRAVQLLLEHSKLESTVRYLGIEVEDALEMAEHTEV